MVRRSRDEVNEAASARVFGCVAGGLPWHWAGTYEVSLRYERRGPPEGGDEAFCQAVRCTSRAHMKRSGGYNALARHEAAHGSGSDTEPALFL